MKVSQPTLNPTRKLSAAAVALALVELAWVLLVNYDPSYAEPHLKAALTPVVVFPVGYVVKDDATVDLARDTECCGPRSSTSSPETWCSVPLT